MPGVLLPSVPSTSSKTRVLKPGQIDLKTETSGSSPPNILQGRRDGGSGKDKPVLYVCASNATLVDKIVSHVERAVPQMNKLWNVYEFTDHREFEDHARHRVSVDDNLYAGICIELDAQNVAHYFGVMCRLALAIVPENTPINEMHVREMRIMIQRLITFATVGGIPLFVHEKEPSWDHFFELHRAHAETANNLKTVHTQGGQIVTGHRSFNEGIRNRLPISEDE